MFSDYYYYYDSDLPFVVNSDFDAVPQAFPGAPSLGRRGEAGRVPEVDDGAAKESAPLQKVSKVRTEFPEAWIWTDLVSRYTLYNARKLPKPSRGFSGVPNMHYIQHCK